DINQCSCSTKLLAAGDPNTEKLEPQFLQTMRVGGAPTQKLAESQLTNNASWGGTTK
ncbi:hypothetical protein W893_03730, partial [Staphylococcus aureus subsp. aureus ST 1413]